MNPGTCNAVYDINFSEIPYFGSLETKPTWEIVLKCAVVATYTLVALIGNAVIIAIVCLSKKMRTTTNFYIVNLAVADLLLACIPTWVSLSFELTNSWLVGGFLCKFSPFLQVNAMCAMSFTMIAIAGDRFFAIVYPLTARVTQRNVKVVLGTVWIFSTIVAIPPPIFYTYIERKWLDHVEKFCTDIWPTYVVDGLCDMGKGSERTYWLVVMAALIWVPMFVMTICYSNIIYLLHFGREAKNMSENMPVAQRRSTAKVVKLLFVLLITFMICTLPYQITTIFDLVKERTEMLPYWWDPMYFCATNLMHAHSCINPIVYGAMNKSFRSAFRDLLHRKIRKSGMTSADTNISVVKTDGQSTTQVTAFTNVGMTAVTSVTDLGVS